MSISRMKRIGPTPADIEFKSMESSIEIIPQFGIHSPIEGLDFRPDPRRTKSTGPPQNTTQYGPLVPPQKVRIPLWMAIQLKKKKKCRIIMPVWLVVAALERTLKKETQEGSFSALPPDYLEISKVLLEVASDDIQSSDQVRILLKDIREVRQSKIRQGLQALNPNHVFMPNLSYMEINELRSFFSLAHKRLVILDPAKDDAREIEKLWMDKPGQTLRDAERREYERDRE